MGSSSFLDVFFSSGPIVFSIFILLILMSIFSWTIIIGKAVQLKKEEKSDDHFKNQFDQTGDLNELFENLTIAKGLGKEPQGLSAIFFESYQQIKEIERHFPDLNYLDQTLQFLKANIDEALDRTLQRLKNQEQERRDAFIGVLATSSNSAPFIGLLGTVIGIVNAFREIGRMGSADLAFVAPAISEALIATALGLFVAIPASIGFNYFKNRTQKLNEGHNRFCLKFQNRIQEGYIFGRGKPNEQSGE